MFTHLHVHTQYSVLDGAANIKKLIDHAKSLGQTAMAITDHGNMFGVKEFHSIATKEGIKPILGCECYVAKTSRHEKNKAEGTGRHLILLAKNLIGYHNLIKMVSYGWTEGQYRNPRIDKELLAKYNEGIICCSACLGGEIPQFIMHNQLDEASEAIEWFKSIFGEDYYLEMQLHQSGDPTIDARVYQNQINVNKVILELAAKHNVKYICTNDVHYVKAEDAPAHDRLICLNTGAKLDEQNRMRYTTQEYLKSEEEMAALFSNCPDALTTTQEITDKIGEYILDHKPYMPNFPLPEDFELNLETLKKSMTLTLTKDGDEAIKKNQTQIQTIENATNIEEVKGMEEFIAASQMQYLEHLTYEGAKKRWGENLSPSILERLDFELRTMEWMGYPGYFLIVWDFIRASREMNVSVGPGRGSAAGSAAAYSLGITNIDPIKYDLLFERFLNPERVSLPDIDIDFDEDGREKTLQYVVNKYGKKRVAHIITFGTMAAKSAIRDVARIHQLPLQESNRLAKLVPERPGITLEKAYKESPELALERNSDNPLISTTLRYAEMLEGTVRSTGVHACGVIIGKDDLENFAPISTAKDADLYVVQFEGSIVEDVGLIKMDFLGLKTLSIIKDAIENVKISFGIDIDIDNIPLDDAKTFDIYAGGETTGLFQFESPGMKKHLKALKPNRFEDLIAMNALYRPGPMEYIPNFIDRKHGREEIVYDLPAMEEYLSDTYGITVYQEQVMLLSQKLAGFTKGQADTLRKAMGKKQRAVLDEMKPLFINGADKNGHPTEICEKIWKDWESFAEYAFNKSHSTCYAYISYQTAYLKAHYPSQFMSALLSRNLSNMDKLSFFMDECKRMGSPVLGPDVNLSRAKFAVDKEDNIRYGLSGIKGVGANAIDALVAEREANGSYKNIYDFVERVPLQAVNKKNIECLALAGAFDSIFPHTRCRLLSPDDKGNPFIESIIRYGAHIQNERQNAQNSLFGDLGTSMMVQQPAHSTTAEEWGKLELLNREKEVVGLYLSAHPLDDFKLVIDRFCTTKISELADLRPLLGHEISIGGIITTSSHLTTKTGKPYGRITIEDFSSSHEFVLFSRDWENFRIHCLPQSTIMIRGRVQNHKFRPGEIEFAITSMRSLTDIIEKDIKKLTIKLLIENITSHLIDTIQQLAQDHPGSVTLGFTIFDPTEDIQVNLISKTTKIDISNGFVTTLEEMGIIFQIG